MRILLYVRISMATATIALLSIGLSSNAMSAQQSLFDINPPTQQAYTPDIVAGYTDMADVTIMTPARIDTDALPIGLTFGLSRGEVDSILASGSTPPDLGFKPDPGDITLKPVALSLPFKDGNITTDVGSAIITTIKSSKVINLGQYGYTPYASVSSLVAYMANGTSLGIRSDDFLTSETFGGHLRL